MLPPVTTFLVVYDWACGQVMSVEALEPGDRGGAQRAIVEAGYGDDDSIEVAAVDAESAEAACRAYLDSKP